MKAAINGGVTDDLKSYETERWSRSCSEDFFVEIASRSSEGSLSWLLGSITDWENLPDTATALAMGASGIMATSFAAVSLSATGSGPAVAVACIPWLPQFWFQETSQPSEGSAIQEATSSSSRARNLSNALSWTSLGQAVCGMFEFVLDDPLSGLIAGGIATLGLQSATPAGYRFLPTYIVLSFCNGTMQSLMTAELMMSHGQIGGWAAMHGGLVGKVAVFSFASSPVLMFTGLAVAWQLYAEQQRSLRQLQGTAEAAVGGLGGFREREQASTTRHEEPPSIARQRGAGFAPFVGASFRLVEEATKEDDVM